MDHAVVTDVLDRDARRHQLSGIGIAFVAHRIEFGGMDDGGRKSGEFGRAKRRNPGIGEVGAVGQIVGEVGFERGPVEQMIFGEGLDATARFPRNRAPDRSGIAARSRPGVSQRVLANHGGERCAGGIAADHEPCRIDAERWRPARTPIGSPRSHPRWRPEICARARGGSRRKQGGSRSFARAPRRCGHGCRCCRRPCRRRGRRRSPARCSAASLAGA